LLIKSTKLDLPKEDLDYHLIRASMVIIFLFFGYQKWVRLRGAGIDFLTSAASSDFVCIRLSASRVRVYFWDCGVALGALLFIPDGWASSAGDFPAMTKGLPSL
jgi:hypothetical protein